MTKTMTRKEALSTAITFIEDAECADFEETLEVLNKMLEQLSKPRTKSDTPSKTKARISNEALAKELFEKVDETPFNCTFIQEKLKGVMTPQKAVAVMNAGIDLGLFAEGMNGKKRIYTKVA